MPLNPAYNKPGLPGVAFREYLDRQEFGGGDPDKAAMRWFELAEHPDPPLRVILGQDALAVIKTQLDKLTKDWTASEEVWSKDVAFDE